MHGSPMAAAGLGYRLMHIAILWPLESCRRARRRPLIAHKVAASRSLECCRGQARGGFTRPREGAALKRSDIAAFDVFCGIDVGKSSNHIVCLDRHGEEPLINRSIPQSEMEIREVLEEALFHGRPLVIVDQFGAFGRLVVGVAKDMGIPVAHMSPRRFRQVAETYGEDKFDEKDAFILADASRTMPRNIKFVGDRAESMAEIKVLSSRRDDVVAERTRCYNRLHDFIHQVSPPLEELFSKSKLHNDLEIRLVARFGGPLGFRRAGRARTMRWAGALKYHAVDGPKKVEQVFDVLDRQTVVLPGAAVIEEQIRAIASRVIELVAEERRLNAMIERRAAMIPEVELLQSIPGVGPVYAAVIAVEIGDVGRFADSNHLASYAGVAPRKEESGTSVHKSKKRKGGNRRLKNALMQSAQRSVLRDPVARAYYERKRAEGKKHLQALRALARHRVTVIYAMLNEGTYYEPPVEIDERGRG